MLSTSTFVAASSLFALALGAPISHTNLARSLEARAFSYHAYGGDGSTQVGWPSENEWLSFDNLWTANQNFLQNSCTQFSVSNNNQAEIAAIKTAIQQTAEKTSIPASYIFAIMMQESGGCVRAPTTNGGYANPGLMQSFEGTASCNNNGQVSNPCSDSTITQMIEEGAGINREAGLVQSLATAGTGDDVSKYYKAARIYNSGNLGDGNLGDTQWGVPCYVSDIANRLQGWTADDKSTCDASIKSNKGTIGGNSSNDNGQTQQVTQHNAETQTSPPAKADSPAAAPSVSPAPAAPSAPAKEQPSEGSASNTQNNPGAAQNCTKWYTVKSGDVCESVGVSLDTLRKLNQDLDVNCSNLWLGYNYCISTD